MKRAATRFAVGIDIGGTKIHAGLFIGGKIVKRHRVPSRAMEGKSAVFAAINEAIEAVWDARVKTVGVAFAGLVDHRRGTCIIGPHFSENFRNVPLARILEKRWRVHAAIDNDARCFALGETLAGAGKRHADGTVVGITLGTGIGGGIIMGSRPYRGAHNAAGEIGHGVILGGAGARHSADSRMELEQLASGSAFINHFYSRTHRKADTYEIERLAEEGDRFATESLEILTESLASGLANLIYTLDPDAIVIGGGIARVRALWGTLRERVSDSLLFPTLAATPILPAKLGDDAQLVGAVSMASFRA